MNLNTLASLAGVSVATVSKAFSGNREISPETRERIFALAREHGCFDKYNKNKFEKKVIAVICPELISDYYNALTTILDRELSARGGIMTVSVSSFDYDRERELFAYYTSYCKADGIIVVNPHGPIVNPLVFPSVAIGSKHVHENTDTIHLSIERAIEDAVRYLKELGHTDIGFAGEMLTMSKLRAFEDAMQQVGLPIHQQWIKVSEARFEQSGICAAEEWIREGQLPTAILTGYDYIAIGVIKTLRRHGIRVPEDVSVIGMDNIALAPYLETSLSSVCTHNELACKQAVELIMKKLGNQYYHPREEIVIPSEFIPRGSTGPVPVSSPFTIRVTQEGD